jgi:hypothetical protein
MWRGRYQAALRQKRGCFTAAGMTKEVAFEPVAGPNQAYREKYGGNAYLESMISARARAATVKVTPQDV